MIKKELKHQKKLRDELSIIKQELKFFRKNKAVPNLTKIQLKQKYQIKIIQIKIRIKTLQENFTSPQIINSDSYLEKREQSQDCSQQKQQSAFIPKKHSTIKKINAQLIQGIQVQSLIMISKEQSADQNLYDLDNQIIDSYKRRGQSNNLPE